MRHSKPLCLAAIAGGILFIALSCGHGSSSSGSSSSTPPPPSTTADATISLSDPGTCASPSGPFAHVWVAITKVTANVSATAGPTDSGWVTLLDLTSKPAQIDLLSLTPTTSTSNNACVLNLLGTGTGLPPGNYQQVRLYLLANNASGTGVSSNNCAAGFFNCVGLATGGVGELQLTSEPTTGIQIPTAEIMGGGLNLVAGQTANVNLDFSACASIVQESNGDYRLKPVLYAGTIPQTTNAISGTVVDNNTKGAIANAVVLVEQPDSSGIDRVVESQLTASDGTFLFCPLPAGNYDLVVAAALPTPVSVPPIGVGTAYNPTVTFSTPAGTASLTIPLVPEGANGISSSPTKFTGTVSTAGAQAVTVDVDLSVLQQATPTGGSPVQFTVPSFPGSSSNVETGSYINCPSGTTCATYNLYVPASNPSAGTYSSTGTTYSTPDSGNVAYTVDAQAFVDDGSNTSDCSFSDVSTALNSGGGTLLAAGGALVTVQTLAFTGCQ
jgi:hypothetical protein